MSEATPRYRYAIRWEPDEEAFIATCVELPGLSGFGDSPAEALAELSTVVDTGIEVLRAAGDKIPEPFDERVYSGTLSLRIPPETHRAVSLCAAKEQISLNQMLTSVIDRSMGQSLALSRTEKRLEEMIDVVRETLALSGSAMSTFVSLLPETNVSEASLGWGLQLVDRDQDTPSVSA